MYTTTYDASPVTTTESASKGADDMSCKCVVRAVVLWCTDVPFQVFKNSNLKSVAKRNSASDLFHHRTADREVTDGRVSEKHRTISELTGPT